MKFKLLNNCAVALALFAFVFAFAFAQNNFASAEAVSINDSIESQYSPIAAESNTVFSVFTDVSISPNENSSVNCAIEPSAKTVQAATYRNANPSVELTPPINPPSFAQTVVTPNLPNVERREAKRIFYADANRRFVQRE